LEGSWLAFPSSLYCNLQINAGRSFCWLLKAGGLGSWLERSLAVSGRVRVVGGVIWEGDKLFLDGWVVAGTRDSLVSITTFFKREADCCITARRSSISR
jgi:hypothetical protein